MKRLARASALSYKAKDAHILVLEDLLFETPKTRDFADIMSALGIKMERTLLVLAERNKNVYLSSRNLQGVEVITASELNTYKTLRANRLILAEGSIEKIEVLLSDQRS